ncbi:MAG: LCP family protein [Lachnospiraceae bacterium]|nr:LCP family protein [Lachnospiraceae bacterium]
MTKRKKTKKKGNIVLFIIELLILAVLIMGVFLYAQLSQGLRQLGSGGDQNDPNAKTDEVVINEGVATNGGLTGYQNIMLIGVDSREGNLDYSNSDVMIIASINNDNWEVRLVSLYRDTYLCFDPENYKFNKANEAYARGSARQLLSMVNANLDLNITQYVTVDFSAVAKLIDDLGGITVYMTAQEVIHLNNYCKETSQTTGLDYEPIEVSETDEPRNYDLNGVQAVSYARIRYTAGADPKRTARQRLVIEKIVDKARARGLSAVQDIIKDVFPYVKTSFSSAQIIKMAANMFNYQIVLTTGFPFEHLERTWVGSAKDVVVPVTLKDNVQELHEFLFADEDYQVSETVQGYSDEIVYVSGYGEESREKAAAASVIPNSGGEADIVR